MQKVSTFGENQIRTLEHRAHTKEKYPSVQIHRGIKLLSK